MSPPALLSLCNDIKNRYIPLRPDLRPLIESDASASAWILTSRSSVPNHNSGTIARASSEWVERRGESGQEGRLRRMFRRRPRPWPWRPRTPTRPSVILPRTRPVHPPASTIDPRSSAGTRSRAERETRLESVFSSKDELPRDRGVPPLYASHSHEAGLPSYDIVIEEERCRVRSLRRRTMVDHANTAGVWRRPRLPSAFFRPAGGTP